MNGITETAYEVERTPESMRSLGPSSSKRRFLAGRPGIMPSSRAVLGSLLCMIAALLTFAAFQEAKRPPRTTFAVATRDLAPGDVLGAGDVEMVSITLPSNQRTQAIEDMSALENTAVLGPVAKGELLQRGMLIRRASPDRMVSFPVRSAYAMAGRLRAGTRISLYATSDTGDEPVALVASNVLVTRVDSPEQSADTTIVITVAIPATADEPLIVAAAATSKLVIVEESSRPPVTNAVTSLPSEAQTNSPAETTP